MGASFRESPDPICNNMFCTGCSVAAASIHDQSTPCANYLQTRDSASSDVTWCQHDTGSKCNEEGWNSSVSSEQISSGFWYQWAQRLGRSPTWQFWGPWNLRLPRVWTRACRGSCVTECMRPAQSAAQRAQYD